MGDLDDGHTGVVERTDDRPNVGLGELMAFGVRTVAQAGVGDTDVEGVGVGHHMVSFFVSERAISLPTLVAAAVMMSRLPA